MNNLNLFLVEYGKMLPSYPFELLCSLSLLTANHKNHLDTFMYDGICSVYIECDSRDTENRCAFLFVLFREIRIVHISINNVERISFFLKF